MTRTEAIFLAIPIISQSGHPEKEEIIAALEKCTYTISNRKWNEENILAACKEVYDKKGRLTVSDFGKPGMPSHTDIAHIFRMTAAQFRDTYFPSGGGLSALSPYRSCTREELTSLFVEEYKRILPKTQADYNRLRSSSLPTWNTVAKWNGVRSWNELLVQTGLKGEWNAEAAYSITSNLDVSADPHERKSISPLTHQTPIPHP